MSIGPILPGRLPASLVASRLALNIDAGSRAMAKLQDQIATGQRFFLPGEDPAAAIRTMVMQKSLEVNESHKSNIATDRSYLGTSEAALAPVSELLSSARSYLQAGIGNSVSPEEKLAMADETASILKEIINLGNTTFRGRFLFGGTESTDTPFEAVGGGRIRYNGNDGRIGSLIDVGLVVDNNVDGITAFGAISEPVGEDIDPALTMDTKISHLLRGRGVELGLIQVTLNDGVNPVQTETIDLSKADNVGDIEILLENAFAGQPVTLDVEIDPTAKSGLRLTPSAGTVEVSDLAGFLVADDLGILGGPAAEIVGNDLDPAFTMSTLLSDLNGGTGIGTTAGNGLVIDTGNGTSVVDISSAATVEDLLNILKSADLDLILGINDDASGLAISSRISGGQFAIGENNGNNAELLGIRTLVESTKLSDLNLGTGVPVKAGVDLEIVRRDLTSAFIDLSTAGTMQDVLDAINSVDTFDGTTLLADLNLGQGVPVGGGDSLEITRRDGSLDVISLAGSLDLQDVVDTINAVDPGNLVAAIDSANNQLTVLDNSGVGPLSIADNTVSAGLGLAGQETTADAAVPFVGDFVGVQLVAQLNTVGNGISIADSTGVGPLSIPKNIISVALGLVGTEDGGVPTAFHTGEDVNKRETEGVLSILSSLEWALRNGDDSELARLAELFDKETGRFNLVRAELGTRLKLLDGVENRILDNDIILQENISNEFDTDFTKAILQFSNTQLAMESTMRVAAQTMRLTLLSYI